jgi:hypothetical protein
MAGSIFWNVCKFYQTIWRHIGEGNNRCHKKTEIPQRHIRYLFNKHLKNMKGTNSIQEFLSQSIYMKKFPFFLGWVAVGTSVRGELSCMRGALTEYHPRCSPIWTMCQMKCFPNLNVLTTRAPANFNSVTTEVLTSFKCNNRSAHQF